MHTPKSYAWYPAMIHCGVMHADGVIVASAPLATPRISPVKPSSKNEVYYEINNMK
jgi:hypothetical protein